MLKHFWKLPVSVLYLSPAKAVSSLQLKLVLRLNLQAVQCERCSVRWVLLPGGEVDGHNGGACGDDHLVCWGGDGGGGDDGGDGIAGDNDDYLVCWGPGMTTLVQA